MSRLPDIKRIRIEDFAEEEQEMVGKLAYSMNTFMDQVINVLTKNVDFTNLNQQIVNYTVVTDSSGDIVNPSDIRNNLNSKIQGIICIKAVNTKNSTVYPTGMPWVSWDFEDESIIQVTDITNLTANTEYALTLLLFGTD